MSAPYFDDGTVALYHGDCRELLPELGIKADCAIADPPYGETSLAWDRWPDGWLKAATTATGSLWCFGSLRMFLAHADEFADSRWKLSQDIVWEKQNGSGFAADRFKRVHEMIAHWYQGPWRAIRHEVPRFPGEYDPKGRTTSLRISPRGPHLGAIAEGTVYEDDGTRLARSVLYRKSMQRAARHPTEKPVSLLLPLIEYACPPGGLVVDLFSGSGSALDAAKQSGRRGVGFEVDERYCEIAAHRLSDLFGAAL